MAGLTGRRRAASSARSDERAYRLHEPAVMGMLSARHRDLDHDGRYEIYHEAWAAVLKRRAAGVEIESLECYLVGAADKLASKRVYGADARRRVTFDPMDSPFARVADPGETPAERALANDEARRLRLLIDELGPAEQAILKLRLDLGLEPAEIRSRLGLSERAYRRAVEQAGKALLAQFEAFDSGDWARRKRSLLCACVLGVASERQRERARRLVQEDPCCRAMMSELRELGGRAALALPLPAGPLADAAAGDGGRAAELVASVQQHVGDLVARVKEHAAGAATRAADPTPFAGARPGTVASVLAGCLAAGGGALCAVEGGIPDPLRPALGLERAAQPNERAQQRAPEPERPAPSPAPVANAPAPPAEPPAPAPNAAPTAPAAAPSPPPPPTPEREFQPAGAAQPGAVPALRAPPAAPAPPAPSPAPRTRAGGGGESGEFQP